MALSEVDICNMALAKIGDEANVASISPPDSSMQAQYCARFYKLALDSVLDDNNWGFSTKTTSLALSEQSDFNLWDYCYDLPSDMINIVALFDVNAVGDVNFGGLPTTATNGYIYGEGSIMPNSLNRLSYHGNQQDYSMEIGPDGKHVIFTNQANAVLKYCAYISDPVLFPPTFIEALTWKLAAFLAGVIIKGDVGVTASIKCLQAYQQALSDAALSDAQNRKVFPRPIPMGIAYRA